MISKALLADDCTSQLRPPRLISLQHQFTIGVFPVYLSEKPLQVRASMTMPLRGTSLMPIKNLPTKRDVTHGLIIASSSGVVAGLILAGFFYFGDLIVEAKQKRTEIHHVARLMGQLKFIVCKQPELPSWRQNDNQGSLVLSGQPEYERARSRVDRALDSTRHLSFEQIELVRATLTDMDYELEKNHRNIDSLCVVYRRGDIRFNDWLPDDDYYEPPPTIRSIQLTDSP